jgi:hypothetical protein
MAQVQDGNRSKAGSGLDGESGTKSGRTPSISGTSGMRLLSKARDRSPGASKGEMAARSLLAAETNLPIGKVEDVSLRARRGSECVVGSMDDLGSGLGSPFNVSESSSSCSSRSTIFVLPVVTGDGEARYLSGPAASVCRKISWYETEDSLPKDELETVRLSGEAISYIDSWRPSEEEIDLRDGDGELNSFRLGDLAIWPLDGRASNSDVVTIPASSPVDDSGLVKKVTCFPLFDDAFS